MERYSGKIELTIQEFNTLKRAINSMLNNLPEGVIDEMRPVWGHTQTNCVANARRQLEEVSREVGL